MNVVRICGRIVSRTSFVMVVESTCSANMKATVLARCIYMVRTGEIRITACKYSNSK